MASGKVVYLVDDDGSARTGLLRVLREGGHDARGCENADSLFSSLDEQAADCLVLDARMPGLTVKDLHQELCRRNIHLPVIFVTADDDPELKQWAQDVSAAGFFRKPVDGIALLDAIDWAINSDKT